MLVKKRERKLKLKFGGGCISAKSETRQTSLPLPLPVKIEHDDDEHYWPTLIQRSRQNLNMANVAPNPRTWTLRFKLDRSTILLEVDPLQRMSHVRAELLRAVQETNPTGKIRGHTIPQSPDQIKLGRPVDPNNLGLGFTSIDNDEFEEAAEPTGKGKGKAAVGSLATVGGKARAGASSLSDCPQGMGFKNGGVIAFKFISDHDAPGDDEDLWVVDMPTMENTYGDDENAEDEGLGMDER